MPREMPKGPLFCFEETAKVVEYGSGRKEREGRERRLRLTVWASEADPKRTRAGQP